MKNLMAGLQQTNSEKILLGWVRQNLRQYPQAFVPPPPKRPELFDWSTVEKKASAIDRLEHAFSRAEKHLGIERLLDPE
ncbi:hypothetical protein CRUP_011135, partial [Coryphaenoides rupestris]